MHDERTFLQTSSFWRGSQQILSPPTCLNLIRVQKIKERSDQVHLPIMHWSSKRYILVKIFIKELHMIRYPCLITTCNTKQLKKKKKNNLKGLVQTPQKKKKNSLQGLVLTPQIIPKPDLRLISHLVSNKT